MDEIEQILEAIEAPGLEALESRIDRIERMLLIMTRDFVDQFSGQAEDELRRMTEELREEHESVVRKGANLILEPR